MPSVYLSASCQEKNIGIDGVSEEVRMQTLAKNIVEILSGSEITIYLNRPEWPLSKVITDSNSKKPNLHIALHSNAGGGSGTETWCFGTEGTTSARFGRKLQTAIVGVLELTDRGLKDGSVFEARFAEIIKTTAPSVLTEIFFHDNERDVRRYGQCQKEIAKAIARVIADHFGVRLRCDLPAKQISSMAIDTEGVVIEIGGFVLSAIMFGNEVYAPVRVLAEELGHIVEWDAEKRRVLIK